MEEAVTTEAEVGEAETTEAEVGEAETTKAAVEEVGATEVAPAEAETTEVAPAEAETTEVETTEVETEEVVATQAAVEAAEEETAEEETADDGAISEARADGEDGAPPAAVEEPPQHCHFVDPDRPLGLGIDRMIALDDTGLFVQGWLWDVEGHARLELVTPEGSRFRVDERFATDRPDVTELYRPRFAEAADGRHGFLARVEFPEPSAGTGAGHRFELHPPVGEPLRVTTPRPIRDPFLGRELVVDLSRERFRGPRWRDCFERLISPTLERLQLRCRTRAVADRTFDFGPAPSSPEISVVVPLFERIDLVEHQIAQLADDPAMATTELLFVLDSPELTEAFERTAFHLSRLYQIPIRGVVAPRHLGYAGATNLGTMHVRGRLLLLLHSDVFPDRPGWLDTLASFHRGERRIGAVGPKLLYEDGSLQHAGITFSRDLEPDGLWSSVHRLKGLPRRHPEASEARTVPAVSGACLMISRQLFEDLGGFRDSYVAGDLEDADLCLRCLARERESWYLPAAELFHLEGQSRQPGSGWRRSPEAALYNRWQLSRRWGGRLETISESSPLSRSSTRLPSSAPGPEHYS